jgi:hypothetical protein
MGGRAINDNSGSILAIRPRAVRDVRQRQVHIIQLDAKGRTLDAAEQRLGREALVFGFRGLVARQD